jgi:universal stress protein E
MASIRRILVAIRTLDADSLPAVLKAAQLARACRAQVEIYHCLDTPLYVGLESLGDRSLPDTEQDLQRRAVRRLEAIAGKIYRPGITVTVRAEWDFPAYEAIIRRAMRVKADLIVASAHACRHHLPTLMRLTDWELVRLSPIPVLLVKDPHAYHHPAILVAVDPTHAFAKPLRLDKEILQLGRSMSQQLRGSLHAVHAYARVPGGSFPDTALTPAQIEQIQKDAERTAKLAFDRILQRSPITAAHRYLIARDPVNAIAEAAQRSRSAIVVLGAISRSGIKRLLIGNTAERVLDQLPCDVLVVKPGKFRIRVPRSSRGARLLTSLPLVSLGYM